LKLAEFACSVRDVTLYVLARGSARTVLLLARRGRALRRRGGVRSHVFKLFVAIFTVAVLSSHAHSARADGDDVKGNVAGTIGLGMLGAELGLILTPTVGLYDHWWAWALFPTVGAAAGVVAGALVFDAGDPDPAVTVSLLGAGFALAVPAVIGAVAIKNKRSNREPKEKVESGGVLRFGKVNSRWGIPAVATAPVFTRDEQLRFGFNQRNIVKVALLSGRF
jgi:hypothetical protein